MRRFLVPRASIENVNVVQSEAEVEEPPPNVVNEFNSNEIVRDPASVERAFSAMSIIKNKLRNKINDEWFNDLMICYTEREIFKSLDDIDIIRSFTAKKSRKGHLPPNFM
ncbi:unnamed protein product [Trifolium pratense]|uniref:Uncharacterized protein n=1 Tax=Trifolium pratense TaxID=57577 RepID=A0ACB0LT49_TRIPR|nr:unnamed protein product [Trifolium pratense]